MKFKVKNLTLYNIICNKFSFFWSCKITIFFDT